MNGAHVVLVCLGVPGLAVLIGLVTWTVTPFVPVRAEPPRIRQVSCPRVRRLQVHLQRWGDAVGRSDAVT